MAISRRRFLKSAAAVSLGFSGLRCTDLTMDPPVAGGSPFGPLLDDPEGLLALPEGFRYHVFSRHGEVMDDGFLVPALHDGMATFEGPDGGTILVRNHEVNSGAGPELGPFGANNELLNRFDRSAFYDAGTSGAPALGGTTTLLYDTRTQTLRAHRLSLTGTVRNCAGGPTPWGTWLTCEETTERAGGRLARDHGYVFEVPATLTGLPGTAVPIRAMGRFNHEAVAVDAASGVVYLTEDDGEGLLYRFLPNVPGEMARGGRLQALVLLDAPSFDTRNWGGEALEVGGTHAVRWIDMEDVEAPQGDLRHRGFAAGAARFARGEGIWAGSDEIYFVCTNGGEARKGQIFRYRPSAAEGRAGESAAPGTLELFVEPNDGTIIENGDNITVAPWGDLVVCEDGSGDDRLLGITATGDVYPIARNLRSEHEFAGACFSPDGSTLFVNLQSEGLTVAITGKWNGGA